MVWTILYKTEISCYVKKRYLSYKLFLKTIGISIYLASVNILINNQNICFFFYNEIKFL